MKEDRIKSLRDLKLYPSERKLSCGDWKWQGWEVLREWTAKLLEVGVGFGRKSENEKSRKLFLKKTGQKLIRDNSNGDQKYKLKGKVIVVMEHKQKLHG